MKSHIARNNSFGRSVPNGCEMSIAKVREAVTFQRSDTRWDVDKIPDEDFMIKS